MIERIPRGYCQCGCGQKTTLAARTFGKNGVRKGEPYKFLKGHQNRREHGTKRDRKEYRHQYWLRNRERILKQRQEIRNQDPEKFKKYFRDWKAAHPEKSKEYSRKRSRKYAIEERARRRAWNAKNPEKAYAKGVIANLITAGKIVRPDRCPACGEIKFKIHAHHDDYSKPREIRWLCSRCHKNYHLSKGEGDAY